MSPSLIIPIDKRGMTKGELIASFDDPAMRDKVLRSNALLRAAPDQQFEGVERKTVADVSEDSKYLGHAGGGKGVRLVFTRPGADM